MDANRWMGLASYVHHGMNISIVTTVLSSTTSDPSRLMMIDDDDKRVSVTLSSSPVVVATKNVLDIYSATSSDRVPINRSDNKQTNKQTKEQVNFIQRHQTTKSFSENGCP